jgi:cell division protein FtsB
MTARHATALLLLLLVIVHSQLWLGRGSVQQVNAMKTKLTQLREQNAQAQSANGRLEAEVRDLKEGLEMVEEKARMELGMVKPNEIFVQLVRK